MSGTLSPPLPTQLSLHPREGARSVSVTIPWLVATNNPSGDLTKSFAYPINLLSQWQSGQFSTIQAVWVDNSTCPYAVRITCAESLQSLLVPAFAQGMYPLIVQQAPVFTATLLPVALSFGFVMAMTCTTNLIFLNTAQPSYQTTPPIEGQQSSSVTFGITGGLTTFLQVPPTGRFYVLNALEIWAWYIGTFPAGQNYCLFDVYDSLGGTGVPFLSDMVNVQGGTSTGGVPLPFYTRQFSFKSPIIMPYAGTINLRINSGTNLSFAGSISCQYGLASIG